MVVAAGTSDLPVAEEAVKTVAFLGREPVRAYDVGVSGLHRLAAFRDEMEEAGVIIAVAGMEGALPSVVTGLVSVPVIGVPTSVGYGASLSGITPLLTMLSSCACGLTVVNIDNGYGAAVAAHMILGTGEKNGRGDTG
jgi:NCAIR mutase (PurE)-related protein